MFACKDCYNCKAYFTSEEGNRLYCVYLKADRQHNDEVFGCKAYRVRSGRYPRVIYNPHKK